MEEDLKKLLEENLKLTREVHEMVRKIRHHFVWQRVVSFIYLLLIVGPVILALIYLPPVVGPLWEQYRSIMGVFEQQRGAGGGSLGAEGFDLQRLPELLNGLPRNAGGFPPSSR